MELYSSRKTPQFRTALNAVLLLASDHKLTMNKAVKAYDQLMAKYENALPIAGILSRTAKRKRQFVSVELVFYGSIDKETEIATRTKNWSFKCLSQLKQGWFSFDSESMLFEKWKGKLLTIDYDALEKQIGRAHV